MHSSLLIKIIELHMNLKSTLNTCLILSVLNTHTTLLAESLIDNTRNNIEKWVETNQIISEEKSQWKIEKELLRKTFNLLDSELNRLNSALNDLDSSVPRQKKNELI